MSKKQFKLVLLTSMVTATDSLAPGDELTVGNDEAWHLLDGGLAKLKGGKANSSKPEKPAAVAEAEEKAAEQARQQAELELPTVHPEGKELNAALAKLGERQGKVKAQAETIAALESEVARLEEHNAALQEQLEEMADELEKAAETAGAPGATAAGGAGTEADTDSAGDERQ